MAVLCALVWLFAVNLCNAKYLVGCCSSGDHDHKEHAEAHQDHDVAAPHEHLPDAEDEHSHDGEEHSDDSHPHDNGEGNCCSTLHAILGNTETLVKLSPPTFAIPSLWAITDAHTPSFASSEPLKRQAKHREWTFTPEVCLGPAFHSHAPPLFV